MGEHESAAHSGTPRARPAAAPAGGRRGGLYLLLAFCSLAAVITALAYWAWVVQAHSVRSQQQASLAAVAQLKADEISRWLDERQADADALSSDPLLASAAARIADGTAAATTRAEVRRELAAVRRAYGYVDVFLASRDGRVLMRVPATASHPLGARVVALARLALRTGRVQSSDLYLGPNGEPRLEFVAPLATSVAGGVRPGVVVLHVDPGSYLYPFIQSWPLPSRSGETLLVERRGDRVVYLNELRFRKGTALRLTLPLGSPNLPAARAASGRTGVMEGKDYRGVRVLAAYRPVPGTHWGVVAKLDTSEVLAPVRTRGLITAVVAALLVALAGLATLLIWRSREAQTSAALRASEEQHRALITNLSAGVVVHGPDTRILLANPRAAELLGLTTDQLQGRTAMDPYWHFIGADGEPLPLADYPVNQVIASGERLVDFVAGVHRTAGTAPVWVICNGYPVRGDDGQPQQVVITFADITELRAAETELRASERKFRETVQDLDEAYFSMSLDGRVLDHNPAFGAMLGFDPGTDLRGRSSLDFWWDASDRDEYARRLGETGKVHDFLADVRVGARRIRVIVNAHTVTDDRGEALRTDGVVTDITALKEAEEEVVRLNAELEQRVRDRTAELDAANRELEAFAYSVSHDLRAPLRHVSGFSELLAERVGESLDEKSRHYLDVIARSVVEMGTLIDDLLKFSRAGRVELRFEDVDMDALVREARDQLEPETESREIEWDLAPLPLTTGDRTLLRQVWVNLLGNAVKYTRGRKPARIAVGADDGEETVGGAGGETVADVYFVRDNGVGFEPEYAHKLFGVFQRLHSSAEFEGTGIGLANVQRIVTRLGGRVWAEGEPGEGATFYFSLPRRKGPT